MQSVRLPIGAAAVFLPRARLRADGCALAAPRTGLTVSLRDPDGRGVAGATVVVRDAADRVVATVTTSADGIARIADMTNGAFDIQITAPGFLDAMANVRVGAGQLVGVELTLDRTSGAPPNSNAVPRPPGIATPPVDNPPVPPARSGVPPRPRSPGAEPLAIASPLAPDDKVFLPIPDRWNISLPDWDRYGARGTTRTSAATGGIRTTATY